MAEDIKNALWKIRKKIVKFEDDLLGLKKAEEALLVILHEEEPNQVSLFETKIVAPTVGTPKGSRKDEVIQLLKEHGPQTRGELLKKISFASGTLSWVLNDKTVFENVNGRWRLKDKPIVVA